MLWRLPACSHILCDTMSPGPCPLLIRVATVAQELCQARQKLKMENNDGQKKYLKRTLCGKTKSLKISEMTSFVKKKWCRDERNIWCFDTRADGIKQGKGLEAHPEMSGLKLKDHWGDDSTIASSWFLQPSDWSVAQLCRVLTGIPPKLSKWPFLPILEIPRAHPSLSSTSWNGLFHPLIFSLLFFLDYYFSWHAAVYPTQKIDIVWIIYLCGCLQGWKINPAVANQYGKYTVE